MKKVLCLLMLFCSLSAFAATNAGTYVGTLNITVNGAPSDPIQGQQVDATINGDIATLVIPDFWYGWIYCGDVTVTAKVDATGKLTELISVAVPLITITSATLNSGEVKEHSCNVNLIIAAGDGVVIDYVGSK